MKIYTLEECMDEDLGLIGTPIRDAVEKEVREAVAAYQESMRLKIDSSVQIITNKQIERCRQITVHNNKKTEGIFAPSIGWITRVFRSCKIEGNELLSALS